MDINANCIIHQINCGIMGMVYILRKRERETDYKIF